MTGKTQKPIEIREATGEEDVRTVARLARDIWTEHYTPIIGAAQVEYMLERFQSEQAVSTDRAEKGYVYDLLRLDGCPVGYSAYRADPTAGEVFLSKLYVAKGHRGQGLSRLLLKRIDTYARSQGCGWIRLTANRHNTGSLAAYGKLGFSVIGETVTDIGGGYVMDDHILRKPVPQPSVKTGEINFRDPFVLAHDGVYYLYGTEGETCWEGNPGRMLVYTGNDLENWEGPRVCFTPPAGFWADRNFWAPECHFYDNAYFLFVSFKSAARRRGTQILRATRPDGPFHPVSEGPFTPAGWEALDGTLFVDDDGGPWGVFCHEWTQIGNGTICAVRLRPDLTGPARPEEEPITLFSARDASWVDGVEKRHHAPAYPGNAGYVTDGPFFHKMADGRLLLAWSSYTGSRRYTIGQAVSQNGIYGPWKHMDRPIYDDDGGHGMFFKTFDGRLMMAIHHPNLHCKERPVFLKIKEADTGLRVNSQPAVNP